MANLSSLLRQVLNFVRRNPDKARRHLRTASDTVRRRTGGKYDRHITKATDAASRYLDKQSGRRGGRRDRPGGGYPEYRRDGYGDPYGR